MKGPKHEYARPRWGKPMSQTARTDQERESLFSKFLKDPRTCGDEINKWVKARLIDNAVESQLNRLVDRHCDRDSLIRLLATVAVTFERDNWKTFAGLHASDVHEKLRFVAERALTLAADVERISGSSLGIQIEMASTSRHLIPLGFQTLPQILADYANRLDWCLKHFKVGRDKLIRYASIGRLVRYVEKQAGSPCDEMVADLIAAVTGQKYTAGAHRNWRNRHYSKPFDPLRRHPAKLSTP